MAAALCRAFASLDSQILAEAQVGGAGAWGYVMYIILYDNHLNGQILAEALRGPSLMHVVRVHVYAGGPKGASKGPSRM